MRKLTTEEFIEKARKIHDNKYDYSKVEYVNSHTKVCIICPEHGEFWQTPNSHLQGQGCIRCIYTMFDTETFIEQAKIVHNNTYDYSKVKYITNSTKVCIICPKHGEFWQTPGNHITLQQGCPKCKVEKQKIKTTKTTEQFIQESINIHGTKYDYSKVSYNGANRKVCIICPEHGEFWQTPSAHTNGKQGCPRCGRIYSGLSNRLDTNTFIDKANVIHNNKYSYSKTVYEKYETPVIITCPMHGDFEQTPDAHLQGKGCPVCGYKVSNGEIMIEQTLLKHLDKTDIIKRCRNIIYPYELDFYIPSKKIAIEFNGIKWHSEEYKNNKNYHLIKSDACKKLDIKLIHVFEDEYHNTKQIVLNSLLHKLGLQNNLPKIYARKCQINKINRNKANQFLNEFHVEGYASSTIHYGVYFQDKLVAVMSFKKHRKNGNNWEMTRFASDYNYICCGIGGKLFKHFISEYNPDSITVFADRRWTVNEENNLFLHLGFKFDEYLPPDYKYVMNGIIKRQDKFNFSKANLLKKYPDKLKSSMTEKEMRQIIKAYRIYDCGSIKYIWKKTN